MTINKVLFHDTYPFVCLSLALRGSSNCSFFDFSHMLKQHSLKWETISICHYGSGWVRKIGHHKCQTVLQWWLATDSDLLMHVRRHLLHLLLTPKQRERLSLYKGPFRPVRWQDVCAWSQSNIVINTWTYWVFIFWPKIKTAILTRRLSPNKT